MKIYEQFKFFTKFGNPQGKMLGFDQKCDMSIRNFKNIESPKMVSKRLYGHYLRRYEQIKTNRILIMLFS